MGLLDRYKKPGGFIQLLTLLETSGEQKREKFMSMIKEESIIWEDTLRSHLLSVERVFSWPDEVLTEIVSRIQPLSLAGVLKKLPESKHAIVYTSQTPINRRKIEEFFYEKQFTPAEIITAVEKFIIETRTLCAQGIIKLDKIDQTLSIEDGIEEHLNSLHKERQQNERTKHSQDSTREDIHPKESPKVTPSIHVVSSSNHVAASSHNLNSSDPSLHDDEISTLKKRISVLINEVQSLKQENLKLLDKLDRIRKIA